MQKKSSSKSHRATRGPSQRQLRAGELIRRALSDVVTRGTIQDPDLIERSFSVTEVRVSPDLRHATCFVAPLGKGDAAALAAALTRVRGYLRGQLSKEVTFKYMPDLTFEPDTSFDKAEQIDRLLHSPKVSQDLSPQDDEE
ncbi:ribosome-binding factor A [Parvibaculum lavamentivorans DS-1]|uniref:Ribosome-binding factor A n=1 Tax=Parvibaculum lavamentivorans (strain DS-1 / DSM 13023 / NCIMB 13966) TaxID=402881 RepID=RBFA_PARL1|nr:30S ribosome-binding factor RbfA [Parvibaculum lavamentivorans]A7HZ94.1 RecName: Full=Ribosome-binding factor A [Parvibaculum lavamentivorans DS-1]ABS65227.1 ribosome-binding factor A [Parvibaculum lavamentivorans DS-1]